MYPSLHMRFFHKFDTTFFINNSQITSSSCHKDLGLLFHSQLTYSSHYQLILRKAYGILYLLRRRFNSHPSTETRKLLYLNLIRPIISYCSPVWRHPQNILSFEHIQRRATKFILCNSTYIIKKDLQSWSCYLL